MVCVDASFMLRILLPYRQNAEAEDAWREWAREGTERVTAPLFFAEVTSVLRESVYFERLRPELGEQLFERFIRLPIRSIEPADLQPRAWELAKRFDRPRAYDTQYLAVADSFGCEFWTADRRLVNSVRLPWVRYVG